MRRNHGGLFYPSRDTYKVCFEAEKMFLQLLAVNNNKIPHQKNIQLGLSVKVLENVNSKKE